jgi:hypothetical protein
MASKPSARAVVDREPWHKLPPGKSRPGRCAVARLLDAASADAGVFTCDSGDGSPIQCDGRTQACKIVNGGVAPGIHAPSCIALPATCASAPTCACLQTALGAANMCADRSGDFTLTEDVP